MVALASIRGGKQRVRRGHASQRRTALYPRQLAPEFQGPTRGTTTYASDRT